MNLDLLFTKVELSRDAQNVITRVLSGIDEKLASEWVEKLAITEGRIGGTYYADIEALVSTEDFKALYEALGYDFDQRAVWQNWWCYGALGCTQQTGYTCDTSKCP